MVAGFRAGAASGRGGGQRVRVACGDNRELGASRCPELLIEGRLLERETTRLDAAACEPRGEARHLDLAPQVLRRPLRDLGIRVAGQLDELRDQVLREVELDAAHEGVGHGGTGRRYLDA